MPSAPWSTSRSTLARSCPLPRRLIRLCLVVNLVGGKVELLVSNSRDNRRIWVERFALRSAVDVACELRPSSYGVDPSFDTQFGAYAGLDILVECLPVSARAILGPHLDAWRLLLPLGGILGPVMDPYTAQIRPYRRPSLGSGRQRDEKEPFESPQVDSQGHKCHPTTCKSGQQEPFLWMGYVRVAIPCPF